jgi:hypothetical protein
VGRVGQTLAMALVLALASRVVESQAPPDVRQWANQAGVTSPLLAWCQEQFRPGQRGWAVASRGRYLVIDGVGAVVELAAFTDDPDLSCYSRAAALDLNRSIQRSETLSGRIAPPFGTAVVCGFVDPTTAKCWQYSPAARAYVEVGGWST